MDTNIYTLKNYGKVEIVLKDLLDKKGINRNKLSTMIAANYNLVNRYYNNKVQEIMIKIELNLIIVLDHLLNQLCKNKSILN